MKTLLRLALCSFLLTLSVAPCLALREIGIITKEDAKAMGLEVRATPSGPDAAWVELEFKPEGKLKDYVNVEMEINEGGKMLLGWAPLGEERKPDGHVVVRFMANRAFVEKITLVVVTGFPSAYVNNEIPLKEFVDVAKIH